MPFPINSDVFFKIFRKLASILGIFMIVLFLFILLILFTFSSKKMNCSVERTVFKSPSNIYEADLITGGCHIFAGADSILPRVIVHKKEPGSSDAL